MLITRESRPVAFYFDRAEQGKRVQRTFSSAGVLYKFKVAEGFLHMVLDACNQKSKTVSESSMQKSDRIRQKNVSDQVKSKDSIKTF